MKLLLIQLSDIHITSDDDVITDRYPQIVNAVKNLDYSLDMCIVVVTGDIAYSGTDEQYLVAYEFFDNLKQHLSTSLSGTPENHTVPVHLIFLPGNHDCDFTASATLREIAIDSVLQDTARAANHDIVQTCMVVQNSFFGFADVVETSTRKPSSRDYDVRLSYEYSLTAKNEYVKILCCNTAWLSRSNESQGRLFFPSQAIGTKHDGSALVIAAFHHPYNWLESNSARLFRSSIESIADLILSGHEHSTSSKVQQGSLGQNNVCVEGGVLQDSSDPNLSEFNAFIFDTALQQRKYANFRWGSGSYSQTAHSSSGDDGSGLRWTPYRTNDVRTINQSQLAKEMRTYLGDPGITLRHERRGSLSLQDVFLYPDLVEIGIRTQRFSQRIAGDRLLELLDSAPKMLITGDTESGKSSLAKSLYIDFLEKGVVPVLIDGTRRPPLGDKVYGYVERLFCEQYRGELLEAFNQTDKNLRMIIVDDYHELPLSTPQKKEFLARLSALAKYLVVLSHDMTADLEELSNPGGLSGSSVDMVHYRIQPFGYLGRGKLVERWMLLGESGNPTDGSFVKQLFQITQTLDTLIGKNYVPSYPIYILSVLQALDNATPIDISASSHGYFYELFIRTALARGRSSKDFDIIASYLAFVAYEMQEKGHKVVGGTEFEAIHRAYEETYAIKRPVELMRKQLVEQGILADVSGGLRFKYNYVYNYFVASYMRDHISDPKVRHMLSDIARGVHRESKANILLFLAHLSKDPVVIDELLAASRALYSGYTPAELANDIEFLAHLWSGLPDAIYEENDPKVNRERMLAEMDRGGPAASGIDDMTDDEEEVDVEDPLVRFVTALRHLEILGQMLKNFPGSLEAPVKLDIARECFHLGLRSLTVVLQMIQDGQSGILNEMSREVRHRHPGLASWEVGVRAKEGLTGLVYGLSYGLIGRVAKAVGSREFFNTYERLLEESGTPAFTLIHAALSLDNSSEFPDTLIKRVATEFEDVPLPLSVLRNLVVAHFHLFPVDFRMKQSISSTIGIKYSNLQLASPRARMLPPPKTGSPKQQ